MQVLLNQKNLGTKFSSAKLTLQVLSFASKQQEKHKGILQHVKSSS